MACDNALLAPTFPLLVTRGEWFWQWTIWSPGAQQRMGYTSAACIGGSMATGSASLWFLRDWLFHVRWLWQEAAGIGHYMEEKILLICAR